MSFAEANDNTPSVNIENSTLCDITIFSPWRWPSALCSKQVLVGFLHLFGILMEPGTMYSDAVPLHSQDDSSGNPLATLTTKVLSNMV